MVPLRAQDYADRRILPFDHLCPFIIIDVHLHLSDVLMAELADFQIYENEAFRKTIVEYKVNIEMIATERNSLLARDE